MQFVPVYACSYGEHWIVLETSIQRIGERVTVKGPPDKIAQALEGDYQPEYLFVLRQSVAGYQYYQQRITELDHEIQQLMKAVGHVTDIQEQVPKRTKTHKVPTSGQ